MNHDLVTRLHLLDANRAWISMAITQSLEAGRAPSDLVVLVLETTDLVGAGIARALTERHPRIQLEEHEHAVEIPTAIVVMSVADGRAALAETNPVVAARLAASPPSGRARAVSIACGGAMLVHAHVDRLDTAGCA